MGEGAGVKERRALSSEVMGREERGEERRQELRLPRKESCGDSPPFSLFSPWLLVGVVLLEGVRGGTGGGTTGTGSFSERNALIFFD